MSGGLRNFSKKIYKVNMVFSKKSFVIAIAAVLLLVAIAQLPPVSLRLKTVSVLLNVLIPQGAWRPLEMFTPDPIKEEYVIQGVSGRTLTIHVYRPKSLPQKPSSTIVIYTPLIDAGPSDPRLVNLGDTFARAGFVVAIPWRSEEQQIITTKDIDDVVSTAIFLKNHAQLKISKLGLFGLSYGNGPTIAAAADPRIKEDISFIISFAGYYDLLNAVQFVRTGEFAYEDTQGSLEPDSYTREILTKTLAYHDISEETMLESAVFNDLRRRLSPVNLIERLSGQIFILHSTDDRYIPYTESLRLFDALQGRLPVEFTLTTIFEHGDYKELNWQNIQRAYWPSVADFYRFIFTLLSKHV